MKAIDLLMTRRSCVVRSMVPPGPTPEELEQILASGIRVPDHGKLYPWRLQVLDGDAQRRLGDVLADVFATRNPAADDEAVETERARPSRAPVLVVVTSRLQPDHPKIPMIEQRLSGGAVCQNLLNAAHALGYVAQWLTEWPAYDEAVKRALGHEPEDDIIGFIYIGSTNESLTDRRRAQLHDVVTHWTGPGEESVFTGAIGDRP